MHYTCTAWWSPSMCYNTPCREAMHYSLMNHRTVQPQITHVWCNVLSCSPVYNSIVVPFYDMITGIEHVTCHLMFGSDRMEQQVIQHTTLWIISLCCLLYGYHLTKVNSAETVSIGRERGWHAHTFTILCYDKMQYGMVWYDICWYGHACSDQLQHNVIECVMAQYRSIVTYPY